jgi:hypothetical protein
MAYLGAQFPRVQELLAELPTSQEIDFKKLPVGIGLAEKYRLGPSDTHRTNVSKFQHYCRYVGADWAVACSDVVCKGKVQKIWRMPVDDPR